jgi:hypothetical protein
MRDESEGANRTSDRRYSGLWIDSSTTHTAVDAGSFSEARQPGRYDPDRTGKQQEILHYWGSEPRRIFSDDDPSHGFRRAK